MTGAKLELLTKEVATVIGEALKQRDARIAALEERLTALEAKPHVKFVGIFEQGRTYEAGDAATHSGGLWICKVRTAGKPGEDFVGWQLAVKRGQAA